LDLVVVGAVGFLIGGGEGVRFRTGKPRKTCTKKRPRITSVWTAIFPELIYVSLSDIIKL
jgi:hypothetical protein